MKLFELIQPSIKNVESKQRPHDVKQSVRLRHSPKMVGQGRHGDVYDTNPHTVTRIGTPRDLSDAHTRYIKTIAQNDRMSSNPYFPRVYKHKTHQYYNPRDIHDPEILTSMEVEKLIPWTDLSSEELLRVGEMAYGPYFLQELRLYTQSCDVVRARQYRKKISDVNQQNKNISKPGEIIYVLTDMLTNSLNNYMDRKTTVNIADPQLKQAIILLKSIKRKGSYGDINMYNIMFRRTPYGVHLVFTDPL